jgi:hypothetical protein
MAYNYQKDSNREEWIKDFANLCLPRMKMENTYMADRLPSTLDYMKNQIEGLV